MTRYLVLLTVACGAMPSPADSGPGDSGTDAGGRTAYTCSGFTYCHGADGGADPQPFARTWCTTDEAAAESATNDSGLTCARSFLCHTDGGGC